MLLIATLGMALFDWINSSLVTLRRVQEHQLQQQAIRNTLSFMQNINPMKNPTGEARLGDYKIKWESRLTEPVKEGAGHPLGIGLYRLGLYDIHVNIALNEKNIANLNLRRTGYHQEREMEINF